MKGLAYFLALAFVFASMPSSSTYQLRNYGFGSGGTASSSSTTYRVDAVTGEQSTINVNSGTKSTLSGYNNAQTANVPIVLITNPNNSYNQLLVTLDAQNNPSDSLFAIAISTDNFTTTNYIKSDSTIGSTLVYPTDYRTYSGWGSGSGTLIIGLTPNTTYYVKAKAIQGKYTETAYGPVASVNTSPPQLSFSVSPANVALGTLVAGSVLAASPNGSITFATNAASGGSIYIASANAGLKSSIVATSITSATADLSAASQGYGAQGSSPTQTSGGPLSSVSPFNGSANSVGALLTSFQPLFTTNAPITGGTASIVIKAKSNTVTPAAPDYADVLTLVAAGAF